MPSPRKRGEGAVTTAQRTYAIAPTSRGGTGKLRTAVLALAVAIAATTGANADVAEFYRGKVLRILVGYGPGAGYDVYARLLGRHIGRHVPGQPTVIIQNMPGAASLTMTNHMYNVAPRDGTAIGLPARGLFIEPLLGNNNARFEARKFTWIGSMSKDVALCFAWHTSGIRKLEDAMTREVLVGSASTTSSSYQMPVLVNALLGTKFKPLLGYVDAGGVGIAMERGEVEGYCSFTWGSMKSARPKWIEQKLVNIFLQLTVNKHRELPDVPLATDRAKDEAGRQALAFVLADQEMGRPVFAPPDVPADRLAALRRAFNDTMKDKEFLADAARMSIDIDPIDGHAAEALLARIYATPKDVIERVKQIYADRGQTK